MLHESKPLCHCVAPQGSNVVEDQDLLEIGILNSAHRQRLLQAIRLLPRVSISAHHPLSHHTASYRNENDQGFFGKTASQLNECVNLIL